MVAHWSRRAAALFRRVHCEAVSHPRRAPEALLATGFQSTHVAVGISGGVDSAVAALLLQRQGYKVTGVHMTNWDHEEEASRGNTACEGQREAQDAAEVCKTLNIPFHRVRFDKEYWFNVFEDFLDALSNGDTPNPDVMCNRIIKFDMFTKYCRTELGAEAVATGHYARLLRPGGDFAALGKSPDVSVNPILAKAVDVERDQSYFLCRVPSPAFANVMFPLGELSKAEVRALAAQNNLKIAGKRSSSGICFIGKRRFPVFIGQYLQLNEGEFVDADGNSLGRRHGGHALYTVGQRARVSGMKIPMFVSGKDAPSNTVKVVPGRNHPDLFCRDMLVRDISWAGPPPEALTNGGSFECQVMVRLRVEPVRCTVSALPRFPGLFRVVFTEKFPRAVTAGQTAAFFDGDACLGGSIIDQTGPTFHELQTPLPPESLLVL